MSATRKRIVRVLLVAFFFLLSAFFVLEGFASLGDPFLEDEQASPTGEQAKWIEPSLVFLVAAGSGLYALWIAVFGHPSLGTTHDEQGRAGT